MADEKDLSPEEKLLRVIQGKKKADVLSSAAPTAASPTPVTAAASVAAALKLKSPTESAVKPPVSAKAAATAPSGRVIDDSPAELPGSPPTATETAVQPSDAGAGAIKTASSGIQKLRRDDDPMIRRTNRLLMVAAALIVVLIGVQIWANVTTKPLPEAKPGDVMLPQESTNVVSEPVESYVKLFEERPWFPPAGGPVNSTNVVSTMDPLALLRQSVRLVAVSQISDGLREAIIVDSATGKMHFLRPGGRMLAGEKGKEKELTLVRTERDNAVLTDGKQEFELK
jgi:hypothetical protein